MIAVVIMKFYVHTSDAVKIHIRVSLFYVHRQCFRLGLSIETQLTLVINSYTVL